MPATSYTRETHPERETLDRVEQDYMSGRRFALAAASHRSAIGYRPPAPSSAYPKALRILSTEAAKWSTGARCELIREMVRALPGAGLSGPQAAARIWDAVGELLGAGWFDSVGAASPEPGRRSDHEKTFTLADRLYADHVAKQVAACYVPDIYGLGWAAAALVEVEGVRL